jgi:hypothetical protein
MTFCTIVEFEWDESFDREGFARSLARLSQDSPPAEGRLSPGDDSRPPSTANVA